MGSWLNDKYLNNNFKFGNMKLEKKYRINTPDWTKDVEIIGVEDFIIIY